MSSLVGDSGDTVAVQQQQLRERAGQLLASAGNSKQNSSQFQEIEQQYRLLLSQFLALGGPKDDLIVRIGGQFFGCAVDKSHQGPHEDTPLPGSEMIDFAYLEQFMKDCFLAVGVPAKEAGVCANVLIEADKRGIDSHGVGRLKPIYFDRIENGILKPFAPIDLLKETAATALLDANLGLGLYVGPYAMEMAIRKAKECGIGFVAVRNSTHYGIAGYYASMAADAGCVGFTGTNARPSIAPTFGVEPCMGTNPLCFGIPSDEPFDFLIDGATSINQRGKIEKYARLGQSTPKGQVIDESGNERTDTDGILRDMVLGKCALCPLGGSGDEMGGYKGYSWAAVVELLSISFQQGDFGPSISGVDQETGKPAPMRLGHFFLAIDVEALCDLEKFRKHTGDFLRFLRASKKDPTGPGRIWTAGEVEYDNRQKRTSQGGVVVPPALLSDMRELRTRFPDIQAKYSQFTFEK